MSRRILALMFQGTGSNVGKSTIVAGVARALVRRGLNVAPFKPQNMSNNAAVTVDGGEIGRAQALQARAARRLPIIDFNPVLLKPEADTASQVIVHGKRAGVIRGSDFGSRKRELMPAVLDSFYRLSQQADTSSSKERAVQQRSIFGRMTSPTWVLLRQPMCPLFLSETSTEVE